MRRNPDGSFSWLILRMDWIMEIVTPRDARSSTCTTRTAGLLATRDAEHRVHCAPAVPGRDRPERSKHITFGLEGAGRRQIFQLVRERPALADPVVVNRPHVEPAQLEDQEHLGGPPADASHLHQVRDKLVV